MRGFAAFFRRFFDAANTPRISSCLYRIGCSLKTVSLKASITLGWVGGSFRSAAIVNC